MHSGARCKWCCQSPGGGLSILTEFSQLKVLKVPQCCKSMCADCLWGISWYGWQSCMREPVPAMGRHRDGDAGAFSSFLECKHQSPGRLLFQHWNTGENNTAYNRFPSCLQSSYSCGFDDISPPGKVFSWNMSRTLMLMLMIRTPRKFRMNPALT